VPEVLSAAAAPRVEVPGTVVDVLGEGIVALGQREGGRVHAFVLDDGDGLTLVDTLFDDDGHRVLAAIAALGRSPGDLKRIVLTHAHRSHLGGLAALQAESYAQVHAHPWEADIVAGLRKAQGVGFVPGRPARAYPLQLGLTLGLKPHRPVSVQVPIGPGDQVGPLRVVDASGHTPGHLAFHWPERALLIAGDAVATWPYLDAGWPKFNLNPAAHRATMARLAALQPKVVGVGHGDPITVAAASTLKDLVAKAA
jgi:glyoxylase-like metal-dependent hydrolase (beta-lactamase superfamily II)